MADHLRLVPKREPDAAEAVRTRVKRMHRPDGMMQCPRCGGRSVLKVEAGVVVHKGRRQRGTVIVKDVCSHCWKRNIIVDMKTGDEKPERVK